VRQRQLGFGEPDSVANDGCCMQLILQNFGATLIDAGKGGSASGAVTVAARTRPNAPLMSTCSVPRGLICSSTTRWASGIRIIGQDDIVKDGFAGTGVVQGLICLCKPIKTSWSVLRNSHLCSSISKLSVFQASANRQSLSDASKHQSMLDFTAPEV
jgi:hypothetical protein